MPETAPAAVATRTVRVKPPRELYASTCVDLNCKCNSALEQMLPGADDPVHEVTTLDLHLNLVGNLGCQALLPAVLQLPALTSLNLSNNQLENACATALAVKLSGHQCLQHLDLSGNPISHAGGKQLLQLATHSPSLQHMALDGTLINPALKKRIDAALAPRRPATVQDTQAASAGHATAGSESPPTATSGEQQQEQESAKPPAAAAATERLHDGDEEATGEALAGPAKQDRDDDADDATAYDAKQVMAADEPPAKETPNVPPKSPPAKRETAGDSLKLLFAAVECDDALPALATVAAVADRRTKKAAEKEERRKQRQTARKKHGRGRWRGTTDSDDEEEEEEELDWSDSDDYRK
jgi:hypothetical protein